MTSKKKKQLHEEECPDQQQPVAPSEADAPPPQKPGTGPGGDGDGDA